YNLVPRDRAVKKIQFIRQYRSYVINYTLGEDLVQKYLDADTANATAPGHRGRLFLQLLTRPVVPSGGPGASAGLY
ncbi:MAG TPA: hypothetical protein PKM25_07540, partial [Candidatus Ozemobacteraceae bacterium]|nr:hypothetical protein [Candidatus Ozemobacteraceae bacterium]